MVTEVPYTAILQGPDTALEVKYVHLPMGIECARTELESRLDETTELVAIVQGNMPVGLGGMKTIATPHQEVPVWPF